MLIWLIGTAGTWLLLDFAYYGNSISSPEILKLLDPSASLLLLYGMSYFFTEFGPNTTTFVYPAEVFPVEVRTTGHGISAAAGKLGAFAGAYLFPYLLDTSRGIRGAEIVAGGVSLAGLLLTALCLPETKGKSLEELSEVAYSAPQDEMAPV